MASKSFLAVQSWLFNATSLSVGFFSEDSDSEEEPEDALTARFFLAMRCDLDSEDDEDEPEDLSLRAGKPFCPLRGLASKFSSRACAS